MDRQLSGQVETSKGSQNWMNKCIKINVYEFDISSWIIVHVDMEWNVAVGKKMLLCFYRNENKWVSVEESERALL